MEVLTGHAVIPLVISSAATQPLRSALAGTTYLT